MARHLFACGTDNDGYPTCQGDGTPCGGPVGQCVALIHPNMPRVYEAFSAGVPEALTLVDLVSKGEAMTDDEKLQARVILREFGVEPDEMRKPEADQ